MSKRPVIPDVYRQRKKLCANFGSCNSNNVQPEECGGGASGSPNDSRAALMTLRAHFPVDKFENRLPAIILKHQIYSFVQNKTKADKELNELRVSGDIRCFHLGIDADDICIVFTEDYKKHVESIASSAVVDKFLAAVIHRYHDLSISKETLLKEFVSKEDEISELINVGLLTVRDVGSWWLSIPRAGEFMKSYIRGRKATLMMIKKSKYSRILQQELETRKLPKVAKLGIYYHIHDIIGAELVTCEPTTSGPILRLKEWKAASVNV